MPYLHFLTLSVGLTSWPPSFSFYRRTFNISCIAGLVATRYDLCMCVFFPPPQPRIITSRNTHLQKVFISPSLWKIILLDVNFGLVGVSFHTLFNKHWFYSLLAGMASVLTLVPLEAMCFSPLWVLSRLPLWFSAGLNAICLGMDFLPFIQLDVSWASWIFDLVSVIDFGKFSGIISSNISSPFLLCSPSGITIVSQFLGIFVLSFFLFHSLHWFRLGSFFWPVFKSADFPQLGPVS